MTKKCSKCKNVIEIENFNKDSRTKNKLRSWCKSCDSRQNKNYYNKYKKKLNKEAPKYRDNVKYRVLSRYSILDFPVCAHIDCLVADVDMLCIDHINNDGNKHRKDEKIKSIYRWLNKNKFPKGFQVLCYNHNMKKEIERTRKKRVDKTPFSMI